MNHEAVWSYPPSPHISLCTAPPGAPPHMHSCHMHNMYPTPHHHHPQLVPQQFPAGCLPHQSYGGFATAPNALTVSNQHYTTHQHLQPQQRPDSLELELLNDHHHSHTHSALHGGPTPLHVSPIQVTPPPSLFLSAADARSNQLELLHARSRQQHRNARLHQPPRTRWHHNPPPLITAPPHPGFLLHFL